MIPMADATYVAVVLIAGLIALSAMIILPRRFARRSAARPAAAAGVRKPEHEIEETLHDILTQINEIGRDIHARIDTKKAALNLLIEEADRKIAELRLILGKPDTARGVQQTPSTGSADRAPSDPPERMQKHQRIFELADIGEDATAIARKTGVNRGEVELILQLRQAEPGRIREHGTIEK